MAKVTDSVFRGGPGPLNAAGQQSTHHHTWAPLLLEVKSSACGESLVVILKLIYANYTAIE